jgi:hypothetical protein
MQSRDYEANAASIFPATTSARFGSLLCCN